MNLVFLYKLMSVQAPILNKSQIESKSIEVLKNYNESHFNIIRSTPISEIVRKLSDNYKIGFIHDYLGYAEDGTRILGGYLPNSKTIVIDTSLKTNEEKYNFVLAHELGHLVLHRKIQFGQDFVGIQDTERNLSGKRELKTDLDFLEWQANYFASCIMLPKEIFIAALLKERKKLGISWVGYVYVDDQPVTQRDHYQTLQGLSQFFKVSNTAIDIRLRELELLRDNRKRYDAASHLKVFLLGGNN
ncbi:MAG: ImmA/IrrE family metallo-endopeptidase [Flavipsychrobacter sp.]